jgi:esterase/lipase
MANKKRRIAVFLVIITTLPVLLAAAFSLRVLVQPLYLQRLQSNAGPLLDYAEAVERFSAYRNVYDSTSFNPDCVPRLLTHNTRTERVFILIHDYTSCPCQFNKLADLLFDKNCNVLMLPLPYHGLKNRMTEVHSRVTAEELVRHIDTCIDIGSGLGKRVVLLGVSAGAVLAAWAGQTRSDIASVIMITPTFSYRLISGTNRTLAVKVLLSLPNMYRWYDQVLETEGVPVHAYPRYATHTIAQIIRVGMFLEKLLEVQAPLTRSFVVITNANDSLADNTVTGNYTDNLKKYSVELTTYEFPAQTNLGSDIIDPLHTDEQTSMVYPQLMKIICRQ